MSAVIVADDTTYGVAGEAVRASLLSAGIEVADSFIFTGTPVMPDYRNAEGLGEFLKNRNLVAVSVGAGTINDLSKLGSHLAGKSYLSVATAASMDGYNAYGASIIRDGIKHSIYCPAPIALVCDLEILCQAPMAMNAAGYADLLAKVPAGADWLLADALAVDPIQPEAWDLIQGDLLDWLGDPAGVRKGDERAIANLIEGLLMAGFAMQVARVSRPASGAEHQFSHLWDMEGHKFEGQSPSHGFKVGIGTLASTALYEYILSKDLTRLDLDELANRWPGPEEALQRFRDIHTLSHTRLAVENEFPYKYLNRDALRTRLTLIKSIWPELRAMLREQLLSAGEIRDKLQAVGAVAESGQIGISRQRLNATYRLALGIRRRYTILDLAYETGQLDPFLAENT